ncbi:MAG: SDR family NAD(P)-dependent oxidoreductase [Oceanospirillales bacterium]|nr:SDR family NAD(P)-dependent oxidoreductase [Oceanospirillales bacterium]MBR9887854.1 SDR family NAD(P)-dependent oxidoreductase [Oceanospirillales bacterium]
MNLLTASLKNQVALVAGAASGIGAECAAALARAGAKVLATDIQVDLGQQMANELITEGLDVSFFHHDVCSADDWNKAVTTALRIGYLK